MTSPHRSSDIPNSASLALEIRRLSLRLVHKAKASHIASALSIADVLAVLASDDNLCLFGLHSHPTRDRLLLSKGHACVALYSTLYLKGFFPLSDMLTYGEDFSVFMNHASHYVPGVEISTGALGHALSIGCGKALAASLSQEKWHVFVVMSDGELQEGSNWEAFMFASHHSLTNITAIIDYNNLQSLTSVDETLSLQPLELKLRAFGWVTHELDGHDHEQIHTALCKSKKTTQPVALILKTTKGKGVSFMENQVVWHYKSPSDQELELALQELQES